MRRSLLRLWLGTSLLGSLLACGCQHARQSCPTCGTSAAPVAVAPVPYNANRPASGMASASSTEAAPVMPVQNEAPVVHTAAKPIPPTSADPVLGGSAAITGVESGGPTALNPYREGAIGRRTFTDITAHPQFAHDPNYHWLVGTVDYSRIQSAWLLRYASVEEEDRYGGSVTLENPGRPNTLKNGQLVRVEGYVINPDSTQLRPAFHVKNIHAEGP